MGTKSTLLVLSFSVDYSLHGQLFSFSLCAVRSRLDRVRWGVLILSQLCPFLLLSHTAGKLDTLPLWSSRSPIDWVFFPSVFLLSPLCWQVAFVHLVFEGKMLWKILEFIFPSCSVVGWWSGCQQSKGERRDALSVRRWSVAGLFNEIHGSSCLSCSLGMWPVADVVFQTLDVGWIQMEWNEAPPTGSF